MESSITMVTIPARDITVTATYAIPTSSVVSDNAADHMIRIYPNPFSESATIEFFLTKSSDVSLSLYNLMGEKLRIFVDDLYPAGTQRANTERRNGIRCFFINFTFRKYY